MEESLLRIFDALFSKGTRKCQVPILPNDWFVVNQLQIVPGRKLLNSLEQCFFAGHIHEREKPVDHLRRDFAWDRRIGEDGFDFRGKDQRIVGQSVIERLDANAIPRQEEAAGAPIPNRKAEHSTQPFQASRPQLFIQVNDHFRVGLGLEEMPLAQKVGT